MIDKETHRLFQQKDQNLAEEIGILDESLNILDDFQSKIMSDEKARKEVVGKLTLQMNGFAMVEIKANIEVLKEIRRIWKMHRTVLDIAIDATTSAEDAKATADDTSRKTRQVKADLENKVNESLKEALSEEEHSSVKWITRYFKDAGI